MIDLREKYYLITGASSGIGKAICQKIASHNGRIILSGRNEERLNITMQSLDGDNHLIFPGNITNFGFISEIIQAIIDKGIKISGFVHSAGIERTLPFKITNPSVFQEIFNVNVFAGFEFARLLSKRNIVDTLGASFIFISSVKGKSGSAFNVAYSASKAALLAGSKSIAYELAPKKIRCNCILPGFVSTEMLNNLFAAIPEESKEKIVNDHPLGLGKPDDISPLVVFLLSDQALWITGSDFVIDGGYSIH